MRGMIVAGALLALSAASPAWAQSSTGAAADVWQSRYVAALRQADDREARLIRAFDADRTAYLARIAQVSRERNVSAQALAEVTLRLGLQLARDGRPADIAAILAAITDSATQIEELQTRIRALDVGADPVLAAQLTRARAAIDIGNLDGAEAILREARRAARAAREGAQLREAEVIGLEANVANLRSDFLAAAALYAEATEVAPERAQERWGYMLGQASALSKRGELFVEPGSLQQAVAVYERALALRPRATAPTDWAVTQANLGNTLRIQGERGVPGALERAVAALEAALNVLTQAANPEAWAASQNNLGIVLSRQGQIDAPGALERAVRAFEAALTVRTREASPYLWATAQMNLGSNFVAMGQRGARGALERAIRAYEAALTVLTPNIYSSAWAMTQIGLGVALMEQAERGQDIQTLARAVRTFESALTVLTPNSNRDSWAMAQANLARAHSTMGAFGVPGALERAVAAYDAALSVYTPQTSSPRQWAAMQTMLGHTLLRIGDSGALARARAAFEAALTVRTREADLSGWAETTYALAFVYRGLGRISEARAGARGALAAYEQVGENGAAEHVRGFIAELDAARP